VRAVADGREALDDVIREDADVIVLDVRMPVMDGVAFMKVVRSYLRFRDVPVIVLTAISESVELDRLLPYDVARVFTKANFDLGELVTCVSTISAAHPRLPAGPSLPAGPPLKPI
jgi:CheY-like chemotaxis protein